MNFENLLDDKKIEKVATEIPDFESCEKSLNSAKRNFKEDDFDWASTIAYSSVLKAGIKLMGFYGYRAIGKEHHKNVFEFLKELKLDLNLTNFFNKIRIKRNEFLYRDAFSVSKEEAKEIILNAENFVHKIRTFVRKNKTGRNEN